MSFNPLFCKEMIRIFKNENIKSVVELGNQTFSTRQYSNFEKHINQARSSPNKFSRDNSEG